MACRTPPGTPISPHSPGWLFIRARVYTKRGLTSANGDDLPGLAAQDAAGEDVAEELRSLHLGVTPFRYLAGARSMLDPFGVGLLPHRAGARPVSDRDPTAGAGGHRVHHAQQRLRPVRAEPDNGMLLPFEGMGVDTVWRLELPSRPTRSTSGPSPMCYRPSNRPPWRPRVPATAIRSLDRLLAECARRGRTPRCGWPADPRVRGCRPWRAVRPGQSPSRPVAGVHGPGRQGRPRAGPPHRSWWHARCSAMSSRSKAVAILRRPPQRGALTHPVEQLGPHRLRVRVSTGHDNLQIHGSCTDRIRVTRRVVNCTLAAQPTRRHQPRRGGRDPTRSFFRATSRLL